MECKHFLACCINLFRVQLLNINPWRRSTKKEKKWNKGRKILRDFFSILWRIVEGTEAIYTLAMEKEKNIFIRNGNGISICRIIESKL